MRHLLALVALATIAPALAAQDAAPGAAPSREALIQAAVLPLPEEFRVDATVLGFTGPNTVEVLRQGGGPMICLADDPAPRFHVACYHKSLEPFMARGRELRATGIPGDSAAELRNAEVAAGKLPMPSRAALWQLTGPAGSFNWTTMTADSTVRPLYVIYIPGATGASTGLPEKPARDTPWVMFPGTPRAHIMFIPAM